jgi:anion-transporting  ArsA/GET3 family ATPase
MMLDMKRTFDDVVTAHSTPERAEQIFANPFYQSLSSSFAGNAGIHGDGKTLTAARVHADRSSAAPWDLIVVDTPPSTVRPGLPGRPEPARPVPGRPDDPPHQRARPRRRPRLRQGHLGLVQPVHPVLTKILGSELLRDVASFVSALETMFGGFRERAEQTYQLLKADGTAFLVVAAPEPDALREASFFVERLSAEEMPLGGLILNRVHEAPAPLSGRAAEAALERLEAGPDDARWRPRRCGSTWSAPTRRPRMRAWRGGSRPPIQASQTARVAALPVTCTT